MNQHVTTWPDVAMYFMIALPGIVAAILGYMNRRDIADASTGIARANQKVDHLSDKQDDLGLRVDGRLTALLAVSVEKAHAEGIISGTKDEQLRTSMPQSEPGEHTISEGPKRGDVI